MPADGARGRTLNCRHRWWTNRRSVIGGKLAVILCGCVVGEGRRWVRDEDRNKRSTWVCISQCGPSARPTEGHDLSFIGPPTIGRIDIDSGRPVPIEKNLLLVDVLPKAVGHLSVNSGLGAADRESRLWLGHDTVGCPADRALDRPCWTIEPVFGTMKTHGVDVETSQITIPNNWLRPVTVAFIAAVRVMQLVVGGTEVAHQRHPEMVRTDAAIPL